ncbi:agamous-like MADS-box protein AGL62 [Andrographis paniculata]|uniref:agamous-like MADS-box protein AGL62 n=1 Tax=Andrographis paniculata TaxID=175694 RepID=UPI0021E91808|nr:agamous-like MADS-box protein AGL62 [Andrographis paniculata]
MYATFSKRRLGLYNKASELSTLCSVDVGVIISSPRGIPHSFYSPSMGVVLERYLNPNMPVSGVPRFIDNHSRNQIARLNQELDEVLEMKEQLKIRDKQVDEIDRTRPKGWWEQVPIESLDANQVQMWISRFENLRAQIRARKEEIEHCA